MFGRTLITILFLAAAAWAQNSTEAPLPPPRNPFSSPIRALAAPPAKAAQKAGQADDDKAAAKPVVAVTAKQSPAEPAAPEFLKASNARDPFLSPIQAETEHQPACTSTGKRCLVIDRIRLQGVVRADSGQSHFLFAGKRSAMERLRGADHQQCGDIQGDRKGPLRAPDLARGHQDPGRPCGVKETPGTRMRRLQ